MSHASQRSFVSGVVCLVCGGLAVSGAMASSIETNRQQPPVMIDQQVIDLAMQRLEERQRERQNPAPPATPPPEAANTFPPDGGELDPYDPSTVMGRKMQILKLYDQRLAAARSALRQKLIPASEVRRLVGERAAFQSLPLERCRQLMVERDQQNMERLARFQDAFGDLPTAARTVAIILMKSGQIDFATALPEDPLTREVEESRGVRRVYFQFYLNPPNGSPRRHNGFVEFVHDADSGLWVPTWADYAGEPMPLFDAEAFVPLRPYDLVFNGKTFVVAQADPLQPPEVFALLNARWNAGGGIFGPLHRW
jgi:hypothetical protein